MKHTHVLNGESSTTSPGRLAYLITIREQKHVTHYQTLFFIWEKMASIGT